MREDYDNAPQVSRTVTSHGYNAHYEDCQKHRSHPPVYSIHVLDDDDKPRSLYLGDSYANFACFRLKVWLKGKR